VTVPVSCSNAVTVCTGTVTLQAANITGHNPVKLGTGHYVLAGGATGTVIVPLNAAGRTLLAHPQSLSVTALSTGPGPAGTVTTQHSVRIRSVHSLPTGWAAEFGGHSYALSSVQGLPATPPLTPTSTAGTVTIEPTAGQSTPFSQWPTIMGKPQPKTVVLTETLVAKTLSFKLDQAYPASETLAKSGQLPTFVLAFASLS
jgi:hypothetical protein